MCLLLIEFSYEHKTRGLKRKTEKKTCSSIVMKNNRKVVMELVIVKNIILSCSRVTTHCLHKCLFVTFFIMRKKLNILLNSPFRQYRKQPYKKSLFGIENLL
jgi:hypothetical protein